MIGEQLPRASKYQRVGSDLLLLKANPYFRALVFYNVTAFPYELGISQTLTFFLTLNSLEFCYFVY
jgi:hypothetical protein